MNKVEIIIKVIKYCNDCRNCVSDSTGQFPECYKTKKRIEKNASSLLKIPEWCPLEDHDPKFVDV
jgi:hypothetical protein